MRFAIFLKAKLQKIIPKYLQSCIMSKFTIIIEDSNKNNNIKKFSKTINKKKL